ncbi:MAG TPA: hypothetical protein VKV25_09995, partial [Acidimicrobiales bacterium]|nr:hypothetical protein [Acidimicrobiales bacterium]
PPAHGERDDRRSGPRPGTVADGTARRYSLHGGLDDGPPHWRASYRLEPVPPAGTGWLDIGSGRRLALHPPRAPLRGRPHRRAPGATWLLGALARHVLEPGAGPALTPGVRALLDVGALDPADPLVHQAQLADLAGAEADPGLEPRWRNPIERRDAPAEAAGCWPVAALVELAGAAIRLDCLHADRTGTLLHGACRPRRPWPEAGWRVVLTAFDDRHNWYALLAVGRDADALGVTWRLAPELDPEARSLRVDAVSADEEAAVEVRLR